MSREERCIVYAHGNDWDGVRSRQRYLMEALARYVPIIFLDGNWDKKGQITLREAAPNVTVVRGLAKPMVQLKLRNLEKFSYLWGWWNTRWIRRKYRKILFLDSENWLRPYRFIPHDVLVFDCIDPCFDRSPQVLAEFELREKEILTQANAVFATAASLYEAAGRINPNVTLINNACAPEDYAPELLKAAPRPGWWPEGDRAIAAYLGSVDWRFDIDMAQRAAEDHPDVTFIIAGTLIHEVEERCSGLKSLPNVIMPGRISVEEGRYLLANCSIGLIPFTLGEMNDAINPVKMYAYAFLGKPVAGSAVRELTARPHVADTGATPGAFSAAVSRALMRARDPEEAVRLKQFACENTWEKRAEQAWAVLEKLF